MIKPIHRPSLDHARVLSALELNNYRFSDKHTVLTPELLEKMAAAAQRRNAAPNQAESADAILR